MHAMRHAGLLAKAREPKLRVLKLSMLTHSKLHAIPNDFICDDRKSLVCLLAWKM